MVILMKTLRPEGFVDPNHPRKVCKLQRSIYGLKQASRSWNKRFDEEIKRGSSIYSWNQNKRLIGLGQNAYMDKILKRYKMNNSKRGHIPMQERLELNKTQGASTPKDVKRMKNVPYASAVGSIIYAVRCTRPDVAFANTKDMFLVFGGNPEAELRVDCYCNARFETDINDMKYLTGYLNNVAASEAEMEVVWIRKFTSRLGIVPTINKPIKMFCDNPTTLLITNEPGVQMGTRHYHRSNLLKVYTCDNLAYLLRRLYRKENLLDMLRARDFV
ncbi:retrotransposon protein, putative, ty1-copia subclass [Tanacetum coccineum]